MMRINNIQTSGGIFTHHFIESIQQATVNHPAVQAETFTLPYQERLTEKELEIRIARSWENLVERWDAVEREFNALDISMLRKRWLLPLLENLGFKLEFNKGDIILEDDIRFPISHIGWAGTSNKNIPVHTVRYQPDATLETRMRSGRGIKALAPHDMLQRYLNLSKTHRWGILCDGVYLRLLRDFYHTYTRGYTEFDLQGIFSTRDFASFRAMFRLLHASRFVVPEGQEAAPIDELYEDALAMGVTVGKDLRDNVQEAIETLGNGFLVSTPGFLDLLTANAGGAGELYREILISIYRILFLLFAEQRGMLRGRGSLFMEEFSLTAFRTLAEQPLGENPNLDLWEKLKVTFAMIEHGVDELQIFPYNGALFSRKRTPLLMPDDDAAAPCCRNDALLRTIRHLTTVEKDHVLQRISYSDLSVEEIGSIYESLLEITPRISANALEVDGRQISPHTFFLDPRGTGRKTSGSYYTPPSLVNELIKSALEPVMLDRLQNTVPGYDSELVEALTDQERASAEEALLKIKVVDPACGSGAFLIAANNKLGLELARIRTGGHFPEEAAIRHARREVLANCIHGVDLNPMAVELCKVSLWINAAVEDAPLNFLDHHIQCGNSLVGATPDLVKAGIPNDAYTAVTGDDKDLATSLKRQNRQELDGQGSLNFKVTLIKDQQALKQWLQASRLAESQPALAEQAFQAYQTSPQNWQERLPFDLWTAAFFVPIQEDQPIPTTHHIRQALIDPVSIPAELQALARQMAEKHRFFHWHLAFPDVFDSHGACGFDVVLGNPPWERVKLQEKEFFEGKDDAITNAPNAAARKRLIAQLEQTNPPLFHAYQQALFAAEAESHYYHNSGAYPLTGVGDINLYQIFAGKVRQLIAPDGRAGMIVPTGVATDYTCRSFFEDLVQNNQIASLYDFENRKGLFPEVHRSYKFCLLTLQGVNTDSDQPASFAFFLLHPDDLQDGEKVFTLTAEDFDLLNPNTHTCPIFRSRSDADLTRKLYQQAPVLVNERTGENPWGISFLRMFDMSNDSHLFRTREEMEAQGFTLEGNRFVKGEEVYLPLYEAKMFWHYDHRFGTYEGVADRSNTHLNPIPSRDPDCLVLPWYWVNEKHILEKNYNKAEDFSLCFRGITNTTNERTGVFSIIPFSGQGNSAPKIIFNSDPQECILFFLSNLTSIIWDFILRKKVGGSNLNFYLLNQMPVFKKERITIKIEEYIIPKVVELVYNSNDLSSYFNQSWHTYSPEIRSILSSNWYSFSSHCKHQKKSDKSEETEKTFLKPFKWNEERRFDLRCDLDALFGHLYNLTREEFAYILDTFPIVRGKDEAEFGEYQTKRVILEKFDALADDPMLEGACIPYDERVSVLEDRTKKLTMTSGSIPRTTPLSISDSVPQPEPPIIEKPEADQPGILSQPVIEDGQPALPLTDYTLYRCPVCERRVLGFALEEHTREVHGGVEPQYEKLE